MGPISMGGRAPRGRGGGGFPGIMGKHLVRKAAMQVDKPQINPGILRPRTLGKKG
ncbi:hypothetical protein FKW77_007231 [Venturia effusa]|uniref:Uncharacterized protein n=1 Tax=Venturia effusa TaxID=50376 RepID=A0A517L9I1_9PEZI|nr:hypothetical protein FKW77_007231 [Venturia effusa]